MKRRFQFFPEPKGLRFTRLMSPYKGMAKKVFRDPSTNEEAK
jgi:hypothetical protein